MTDTSEMRPVVLTIGHSTRPIETFIRLLQAHEVMQIVDVRTVPRSRRNPQFSRETLPDTLRVVGIGYMHMAALGGLRRPRPDSPNNGWRNASFRGFADYMETPAFEMHLYALLELARQQRLALLCAEAVPWRCHRSLIADALTVRGTKVEHILGPTHRQAHELTPWARLNGTHLTYPSQDMERSSGDVVCGEIADGGGNKNALSCRSHAPKQAGGGCVGSGRTPVPDNSIQP
jgi:uncharacterized protein (DUF488 family)